MTPQEFVAFRKQLGWSLATLSRHIGMTASRLADYETGHTRGKNKKPAPIPLGGRARLQMARARAPAADPGRERRTVA